MTDVTGLDKASVEVVDVAAKGVATQSSLSRWSAPSGAQAAVSGDFSRDFTIHTGPDDANPWWILDLGAWYPVERLVVRNRKDPRYWDRSKNIRVEASEDGKEWTLLHAGFVLFGADDSNALTIPLGQQLPLRYVRISLEGTTYLHLNRVEVLVPSAVAKDRALMESVGVNFTNLTRDSVGGVKAETYRVLGDRTSPNRQITGLKVVRAGRFANNVLQMARALLVATKYNLDFVQMIESEHFDFTRHVSVSGPAILPASATLPAGALVVAGDYFFGGRIADALNISIGGLRGEALTAATVRSRLAPFRHLPTPLSSPSPDELVIHVRSGDLFGNKPHPRYGQPPLAYYALAVKRGMELGFRKVRVVAEDRLNPVVDALERHLDSGGIPVTMQIGESLATDLATLLGARGLVFGVGTFGPAICMLSSTTEVVFEASGKDMYRQSFPHLDVISAQLTENYAPFERWDASSEQKNQMLNFPIASVELRERAKTVSPPHGDE